MKRKNWKRSKTNRYHYRPGLMDLCDPNVISGAAIARGSVVSITNDKVDPCGLIVWVIDEHLNEQSIWRAALVAVETKESKTPNEPKTTEVKTV